VKVANYISIFCDEVTSVDNQNWWLSLHAYVIKDWSWIPILVSGWLKGLILEIYLESSLMHC
jgi:hypothetical protein